MELDQLADAGPAQRFSGGVFDRFALFETAFRAGEARGERVEFREAAGELILAGVSVRASRFLCKR